MNVCIEKIEIVAFGKLKNTVVTPQKGINILSAPNESGKSTLAAFIKFVFYGYVNSRVQTLSENDKKLYSPWGSEVSEGSITINADGTRYTVHRLCPPSGKETAEIINRATGKTEFIGAVPGEVFFGVGEDVFSRTLFFKQLTLPQNKDEELAERLRNIAISADEQVGTAKAVDKLKKSKNELVGKAGKGIIPKLTNERDSIEETLTQTSQMRSDSEKLRCDIKTRADRIKFNESNIQNLQNERKNIEKYDALLKLQNINRLAVQEQTAREEYESAASMLKKVATTEELAKISAVNTELFAEQRNKAALEENLAEAESELAKAEKQLSENDVEKAKNAKTAIERASKISRILLASACILPAAGGALFFAMSKTAGIVLICAGVLSLMLGVAFASKKNAKKYGFESLQEPERVISAYPALQARCDESRKRLEKVRTALAESQMKAEKLAEEIEESVSAYITAESGNAAEKIERIRTLSAEIAKAKAVFDAKKSELDNALSGVDAESLTELARGATQPKREKNIVDRELNFYNQQNAQLGELNRRAEIDCASMEARCGDLATMIGKRDALNSRIADLTLKHKAYETAMKIIEEAGDHMKSMVAPRIGKRADEYFVSATDGKYHGLEIDTRLAMTVGEDIRRSSEYLSAGTRDSAYLSLRFALADMLFGGCGVPMILDDAFVRLDDERLKMMANAVQEAAKLHQIFIFTHSRREMDAFDEANVEYSEISIN